ncbi:MAG: RDD family protein [Burkholderiales bacterium]|nr:RDD family protein [Opitutaceae bacterium]
MRFFIGRHGQRLGPFDEQAVRDQLAAGVIGLDDLVWREGLPAWQPVRNLFPPATAHASSGDPPPLPPPATPPPLPFTSTFATPAVAENVQPVATRLARRDARLGAFLLDLAVSLALAGPGLWWLMHAFAAVSPHVDIEALKAGTPSFADFQLLVLHLSAPLLAVLVPSLVLLVIQTWLLTTRGQTLGKKWLRIRIVRTDGRAADFVQVFLLRSMALQLVALIPVVGVLISVADPLLIFRADRRCLHDLLAGTTVIDA